MKTADILDLTIVEAHALLTSRKLKVADLVSAYKTEAEARNAETNAYLEFYDDIDTQVARVQQMIDDGKATVLTGMPLAIKDNLLIEGKKVTSASKILEGYVAPYTATAVQKLLDQGVVFIGRTNMDEFAMGGSNETSAYGPVHNPFDPTRVPGGSSGGSAAAVAEKGAIAALGSDTGGSIRQPSSLCGLVGLKPTYGRVSRYGLMAMASSLDQIGPIAKTVTDAELLYEALKGTDTKDSTSFVPPTLDADIAARPMKNKIGVPYSLLKQGVDTDVLENFTASVEKLKTLGYEIVDVDLKALDKALALYYILMPAEASSNLSRFDGIRFGAHKAGATGIDDYFETRGQGFGKEVRRRIMLGTYVLSSGYYDAYYGKAQEVRAHMTAELLKVFDSVDAILTPTSPVPAFKIGEKSNDPLAMYLADIFTVSANIARVPAMSVPSGFAQREDKQLPLGIQFMAPHFREDILFTIGKKFLGE